MIPILRAASAGLCLLALLGLPSYSALAQQAQQAQQAEPTSSPGQPRTLLKLGTGLTDGLRLNGYAGLSLPVVLGVEHHLSPAWTVEVNGYSGWNVGRRPTYQGSDYRRPLVSELGFDAGIRRYYNQEKRRQKGRATGPFVGNYLALNSSSRFVPNRYRTRQYFYDYSTLDILWGMQRRLGKHGLLDVFAGGGIANPSYTRFIDSRFVERRELGLSLQAGVKLSLVNK